MFGVHVCLQGQGPIMANRRGRADPTHLQGTETDTHQQPPSATQEAHGMCVPEPRQQLDVLMS
jgi:hypothetical protein